MQTLLETNFSEHADIRPLNIFGHISDITAQSIRIKGLSNFAKLGDQIDMLVTGGGAVRGEVIKICPHYITLTAYGDVGALSISGRAIYIGQQQPRPTEAWIGHVLDHAANRLDGGALPQGDCLSISNLYRQKTGNR